MVCLCSLLLYCCNNSNGDKKKIGKIINSINKLIPNYKVQYIVVLYPKTKEKQKKFRKKGKIIDIELFYIYTVIYL